MFVPCGKGVGRGRGFRRAPLEGPGYEAGDGQQVPIEVPVAEISAVPESLRSLVSVSDDPKPSTSSKEPVNIGTSGEQCDCLTNFVKLKRIQRVQVYEYHVSFVPVLESTKAKRGMVKQLETVIGNITTFDGHTLYLPKQLPNEVSVVNCRHPYSDSIEVATKIKFIKEKNDPEELTQFYNTLFQRILLNHGYVEIRRGFYKMSEVKEMLKDKLEVWPGVALSVEVKDDGLFVMFDSPSRVVRMESLYDFYVQLREREGGPKSEKFKKAFLNFVIGKIVMCSYSNQCYKIDDVAWEDTPMSDFIYRNKKITYKEYFKRQYNVTIKDEEQVLVVSRIKPRSVCHPGPPKNQCDEPSRVVALVPELCHLTGLTADQRSNYKLMTEISAITKLNPRLRLSAMQGLLKEITQSSKSQEILANWGLQLDTEVVHAIGRKIASPHLTFDPTGESKLVSSNFNKEACRSCYHPVPVTQFLVFCVRKDLDCARNFIAEYSEACSRVGIKLRTNGEIIEVDKNRETISSSLFVEALRDSCTKNNKIQFVVVILPFYREDLYRAVKKFCLTMNPIPSQCVMSRTLRHRSIKSVTINICLQINCKLGGSLWGLKMPMMKKVMVIGMDAAHDPSKKNPSVIAMVATLNATCTSYFSRCELQPIHQEISTSLRIIFIDALDAYRKHNAGELPDRILFYRDGGSAGTFEVLKKFEVDICLEVLRETNQKDIKFSYICVAKRIPQRIFLKAEGKRIDNPLPGTVLDNCITTPSRYDFYIVSQQVHHGTVNPTHYSVLYETKHTKPDSMQKISYALTFMYYNWQGTIKVPSVIQYSHKLGQLVSRIQQNPNRAMSHSLYFL